MRWTTVIVVALLLVLVLLPVYGYWRYARPYTPTPPYESTLLLTSYAENGVAVEVRLESDRNHHPLIATTFTPQFEGFHLYGQSLPKSGIDGIGRPTTIEMVSNRVRMEGPVNADVLEQVQRVGDMELPIYPEGAVTLRLPVSWEGASDANLHVTYMACSDTKGCLLPVINHPLSITLPVLEEP